MKDSHGHGRARMRLKVKRIWIMHGSPWMPLPIISAVCCVRGVSIGVFVDVFIGVFVGVLLDEGRWMVYGMMAWNEFSLVDGNNDFPVGPMEIPKVEGLAGKETLFLGIFGITGLTGNTSFF